MKYEVVQRIPKYYVTEDGVQVMISHLNGKGVSILNGEGLTYHYFPESNLFVNTYSEEKRKENIPYSNIHNYIRRIGLKKYEYVNQFFEFNKIYIQISDGALVEHYVMKDGEEALIATKCLIPYKQYSEMNKEKINNYIMETNCGIFNTKGQYYKEIKTPNQQEETKLVDIIEYGIRKEKVFSEENIAYIRDTMYSKLKKEEARLFNPLLEKEIILVNQKNNEITEVQSIYMELLGSGVIMVRFNNYPITKYSLAHLKRLETSGRKVEEPNITKRLNPHIDENEIQKAKELILSRK